MKGTQITTATLGLLAIFAGLHTSQSPALASAPDSQKINQPQTGELMSLFQEAAQEFEVPLPLLLSVSHTAGQWFPIESEGSVHAHKESGHMGLRDWGDGGPSAELGADLLGISKRDVLGLSKQNIRAGAALLAYYAEDASGAPASPILNIHEADAWWQAVASFAGAKLDVHGNLFASKVFHGLQTGLEAVNTRTGEWLYSAPQALPPNILEWIHFAEIDWADCRARTAEAGSTDYPDADSYPACANNYSNYSRTSSSISHVIIHVAEGSYQGTLSWFQNCSSGVSAHYTVSKNGEVGQSVREEDVAYHAGNWDYNLASVGIEHEGYTYTASTWTDAMYRGSAALTADICNRNNIPKSRTYIIGHNEVPGCSSGSGGGAGCHTDPGPYFDWDYYMSLVGGDPGSATPPPSTSKGNIVGIIAEDDVFSGPRIPGATVSINGGSSTTSDSSGYYSFISLATDDYTITASAPGYASASRNCSVQTGLDTWCSIALSQGSGGTPVPDPDPLPTGCDEKGQRLTASATGASTFPISAIALLLGLGARPLLRRKES